MQILFDHLSSLIIGSVVMMMMAVVTHRSQQESIEATAHEMFLRQQTSFVKNVLRQDMVSATRVKTTEEQSGTFVFYTRLKDGSEAKVTYRRLSTGSLDDGTPLYRIERNVDGSRDGGSMGRLTQWTIEARNENNIAVSDPAQARRIYVSFEAAYPVADKSGTTEKRTWEATYRPAQMSKKVVL